MKNGQKKLEKYRPASYDNIIGNIDIIPQIRIEDKECGCQFWKSGVDGLYSRTKTCSNYPDCKGKLFEKAYINSMYGLVAKSESITVISPKNFGKTVFTPELLQKCPECKSVNVKRTPDTGIKFKCNDCGYEYPLAVFLFDFESKPIFERKSITDLTKR